MMSRRNRRKFPTDGFVLPLSFTTLVTVLVLLALGCVWIESRCGHLGRELRRLEKEKSELTRRCLAEESIWARMRSPLHLDRALTRHGLTMAWPRPDQIVRLTPADMRFTDSGGLAQRASLAVYQHIRMALHD